MSVRNNDISSCNLLLFTKFLIPLQKSFPKGLFFYRERGLFGECFISQSYSGCTECKESESLQIYFIHHFF